MNLGEFIKQFIAPNTLIRLWQNVPEDEKNKPEFDGILYCLYCVDGRDVSMSWQLEDNDTISQLPVKHVTDILSETYVEAVNIVLDI